MEWRHYEIGLITCKCNVMTYFKPSSLNDVRIFSGLGSFTAVAPLLLEPDLKSKIVNGNVIFSSI